MKHSLKSKLHSEIRAKGSISLQEAHQIGREYIDPLQGNQSLKRLVM